MRKSLAGAYAAVSGLDLGQAVPPAKAEDRPGSTVHGLRQPQLDAAGIASGPATLEQALSGIDRVLEAHAAALGAGAEETRKLIETARQSALNLAYATEYLKVSARNGLSKSLIIPPDFMSGCALDVPVRGLRVPERVSVKLQAGAPLFEILARGGLAPHRVFPIDGTIVREHATTRLREDSTQITLKAVGAGTTSVQIIDNTSLGASVEVTVLPADDPGKKDPAIAFCPTDCDCMASASAGQTFADLEWVQRLLLQDGYFKAPDGTSAIKDPVDVIDGTMGPRTRAAICLFAAQHRLAGAKGALTPDAYGEVVAKVKAEDPDGPPVNAYHPYEKSSSITRTSLQNLKMDLGALLARQLPAASLDAYEFDKATRDAIAAARIKLPELPAVKDWHKAPAAAQAPPQVPLEQQLDKALHDKVSNQ